MSAVPSTQHDKSPQLGIAKELTIRPKEQQLWFAIQVHQAFLNSWALTGDKQVNDSLKKS